MILAGGRSEDAQERLSRGAVRETCKGDIEIGFNYAAKKKNVKSVRRTIDVAQCPGQVGQGEISVEKNEMVLDYNLQHCLEQCMNVFTACITCQRLSASFFQHSPDPKVTDL